MTEVAVDVGASLLPVVNFIRPNNGFWGVNPEASADLEAGWRDGWTCKRIADVLADKFNTKVTKNMVIGRAGRLGLSGREQKPKQRAARRRTANETRKDNAVRERLKRPRLDFTAPAPVAPEVGRVTFFDLQSYHCRYPIGEGAALLFCGDTPVDGLPYCLGHCRVAYQQYTRRAA